jgi:hypothetical protein
MALEQQLYRIRDFLGGRNSTFSEPLVAPNESTDDINCLFRPIGALTKRPGWVRYYNDSFGAGVVRGLHKHYALKNDNFTYVYVPSTLWSVTDAGVRVAVKNDFAIDTIMRFVSARDRTYGTNFKDLPIRTDGTIAGTATAELEEPTIGEDGEVSRLVPQVNGPSNPIYGYKFTAYYGPEFGESGYGQEEADLLKEGVLTPAKQYVVWTTTAGDGTRGITNTYGVNMDLTAPVVQLPPGAVALRIYRTQGIPVIDGSISGSRPEVWWAPYYYLDEVRLADLVTPYRDNIPDQELGDISPIGPLEPLHTPYARYITAHATRVFYANCTPRWLEQWKKVDFTDNAGSITDVSWETHRQAIYWLNTGPDQTSRVYWTQPNTPDNVEGFLDVFPQDGDVITGIISVGPNLLVLKRRHTYQILGYSPDDFEVRLVSQNVGCVAPRSIAIMPHQESAIWLGDDAVYTFDGGAIRRVSDKIRADLLAIPRESKAMAVGVVHENRYHLSVAEAT